MPVHSGHRSQAALPSTQLYGIRTAQRPETAGTDDGSTEEGGVMDLIERQAVIDTMRLYFTTTIEALEAVEIEGKSVYDMKQLDLILNLNKGLCNAIRALPSAKSEIIRCKDCKKRVCCRTSSVWAVAPSDNWYCADAERRENG